jgi:hypothetical protein
MNKAETIRRVIIGISALLILWSFWSLFDMSGHEAPPHENTHGSDAR